jgi:predicted PurR-regulated permease PerM
MKSSVVVVVVVMVVVVVVVVVIAILIVVVPPLLSPTSALPTSLPRLRQRTRLNKLGMFCL